MAYTLPQLEHDLIDACIAKDRLAQKRLYNKYKDAMFTLTYRITGDFSLAGEALQDGFLNVFKNLSKFNVLIRFNVYPHISNLNPKATFLIS